jgi:catechol-2,3-dioxygenase
MFPSANIAGMPGTAITTAFIPVRNPHAAADWYRRFLGLSVAEANTFSAVLTAAGTASVTLMGPDSGIKAAPGLAWATCNFMVDDLTGTHAVLAESGVPVSAIEGSPEVCLFFTAQDPDGNTLLLTDR